MALVRGAVAALVGGRDRQADQQPQLVRQNRELRHRFEVML
jgi:hypothetical protein